jgi:hypothetical protein
MKRYRFFQAPAMAFFSPSFYKDVGLNWKGTGFAYLLLLLAICWIPLFIKYQLSIVDFVDNKAPSFISQIPPIKIIKGEASSDVIQPYKIIEHNSGKVLALIDTTGKTVSLEGTEAKVVLTKTEFIIKKDDVETRVFSLKKIDHFVLDKQSVSSWLKLFRNYGALVLFPFFAIGSFVFRIMQLLIYAVIGLLFTKICKAKHSYQTLLRLSVMAITPVIIISTVVEIAAIKIPWQSVLYFIAAMGYLFFGVKVVSHKGKAPIKEDDNQRIQMEENQ